MSDNFTGKTRVYFSYEKLAYTLPELVLHFPDTNPYLLLKSSDYKMSSIG